MNVERFVERTAFRRALSVLGGPFDCPGFGPCFGGLNVSPRDHTNAKQMSKLTDEDIRLAIAEGGDAVQKSELMPPWGNTLTAAEIDGLVRYLRKLCKCEATK